VIDSTGKEVEVYDSGSVIFYSPLFNKWIAHAVNKLGFTDDGAWFIYKTSNCSGTPYFPNSGGPLISSGGNDSLIDGRIAISGGLIYYATAPADTSPDWYAFSDFNTCVCVCFPGVNGTPFATRPVSDLGFTPPFSLAK
jgi:hypothetical protein